MPTSRKGGVSALVILACAAAMPALAVDVGSDTTVGGLVFFDVSNISLQNEDKTGKKVDTPPNGVGFDVKRFYLIVDHKFNDVWSANLTTDAQYSTAATTSVVTQPSTPGGNPGTVNALSAQNTSGGVTEVMIKKLYLQGKFDPGFIVRAGSADMPWDVGPVRREPLRLPVCRKDEHRPSGLVQHHRLGPPRLRRLWRSRAALVRGLSGQRWRL
jgi:hypothetical protein